jgi:argininosuccinate synthase
VLRLAHIDIEGMTVDSKVKSIMAWIGNQWSQCLYNGSFIACDIVLYSLLTNDLGMYFSPERELLGMF